MGVEESLKAAHTRFQLLIHFTRSHVEHALKPSVSHGESWETNTFAGSCQDGPVDCLSPAILWKLRGSELASRLGRRAREPGGG